MRDMIKPNTRLFRRETVMSVTVRELTRLLRKTENFVVVIIVDMTSPPTTAMRLKYVERAITEMVTPITLGATMKCTGLTPMTSMASVSWATAIFPNSVAIAVPERPITTKDVSRGPNSLTTTIIRMGAARFPPPYLVNWVPDCMITTAPRAREMSVTTLRASTPEKYICFKVSWMMIFGPCLLSVHNSLKVRNRSVTI